MNNLKNISLGHASGHTKKVKKTSLLNYSDPKLYIAKKKKGDKKVPSVEKGAKWYVYFYFRNPTTGKMDSQPFKVYKDINRLKTITERKRYGAKLIQAVRQALEEGYNPFIKDSYRAKVGPTIENAFVDAFESLKPSLKPTTKEVYRNNLSRFIDFLKQENLENKEISLLSETHVIKYFNQLKKGHNGKKPIVSTTLHNIKSYLSAIMLQMKKDKVVDKNVFEEIDIKKSDPVRNEIFTDKEFKLITETAKKENPALYYLIFFIYYTFLRNMAILKIQVKHCDMERKLITIPDKTEVRSYVIMVEPIYNLLKEWDIENLPGEYYLITEKGVSESTASKIKPRYRRIGNRFRDLRKRFNVSETKTLYSFRHNGARSLYEGFLKDGKTQHEAIMRVSQIMRHKGLDNTTKYLRNIGAVLPKDYSDTYSINM